MPEAATQQSIDVLEAMSPEERLLLLCARTDISPPVAERIRLVCGQSVNWDSVLHLAESHGVTSLLSNTLQVSNASQGAAFSSVPANVLHKLRYSHRSNLLKNLKLTSELTRLQGLFEEASIQAIAFKGPVLAQIVYGSTALRSISDIDLLVSEGEMSEAQDVLQDAGYALDLAVPWERHFVNTDGHYIVDLHSQVLPSHQSCNLEPDYWWKQISTVSLNGVPVKTFNPEAQILMIFLHGTKDCWCKLSRICDLAELLRRKPDLDWDQILGQARKYGYQRMIYLGLRLATESLDAPLPEAIRQQVYSDSYVQKLAQEVYEEIFSKEPWIISDSERTVSFTTSYDRLADKLRAFWGLAKYYGWSIAKFNNGEEHKLPEGSVGIEIQRSLKLLAKVFRRLVAK